MNETIAYNASMSTIMSAQALAPLIGIIIIVSIVGSLAFSFAAYTLVRRLLRSLEASVRYAVIGGVALVGLALAYFALQAGGSVIADNWTLIPIGVGVYAALCCLGWIIDRYLLNGIEQNERKYKAGTK